MEGKANATFNRSSDTAIRALPKLRGAGLRTHLMLCLLLLAAMPHLMGQVNTGDVVGTSNRRFGGGATRREGDH